MGLKDCRIILDNPWNSYHPGQTINGTVEYVFDSPKKVRGIYIQFRGFTETSWLGTPVMEKRTSDNINRPKIPYTGNEECFNITYYLLGSKSGGEIQLPAGEHSYPFSCALPPSLPSSFENEFGCVRYTIKTTLDRPWKFDQETEMIFTIINVLDLNANPENRKPIHLQMEKSFCCFCCKSGPLMLDAHIPISGFCSGQAVPIEISCENGSNVHVEEVKVEIRKIMKFRAQFPTSDSRNKTEEIVYLRLGGVGRKSSMNWKENLEIPPIPPPDLPDLSNCGLIDVYYDLQVTAVTSGCHMNLDDSIPITLGTVPLEGFEVTPQIDPAMEGTAQPGVEMPLLTITPGMSYPESYDQQQPPPGPYVQPQPSPGAYGQPQPSPGAYGQPQPSPGAYGQPQPSPGAYGQQQPPGAYGQQQPPGAYGQPQPQTQFPGWVNPQTGQPAFQQSGNPQNPYTMPANQNVPVPGAPPQFPTAPQQ